MKEQEVVGLDISVDDALRMALRNETEHAANDGSDLFLCERVVFEAVQDPAALTQLHHKMDALHILEDILHAI